MKAFEVFSQKDIRTAARLIRNLLKRGGTIEDLYAAAQIKSPTKIMFTYDPGVLPQNLLSKGSFLNAVGWIVLRSWLRVKKEFDRYHIEEREVRSFVRKERRKWLNEGPDGPIKP